MKTLLIVTVCLFSKFGQFKEQNRFTLFYDIISIVQCDINVLTELWEMTKQYFDWSSDMIGVWNCVVNDIDMRTLAQTSSSMELVKRLFRQISDILIINIANLDNWFQHKLPKD